MKHREKKQKHNKHEMKWCTKVIINNPTMAQRKKRIQLNTDGHRGDSILSKYEWIITIFD